MTIPIWYVAQGENTEMVFAPHVACTQCASWEGATMRHAGAILCLIIAGCAQPQTAAPVAVLAPPPVEKPQPPQIVVREVVKRVVVEKPVIVERRVEVPAPPRNAEPPKPKPTPVAAPVTRKPSPPAVKPPLAAPPKLVIVVIDGDTVDVNGARWRLTGYDAPEIVGARCPREKALGEKAKWRLQQILGASKVTTETLGHRDRFGRILGSIRADGRDVGDLLAAEGLARKAKFAIIDWCEGEKPQPVFPKVRRKPLFACKGLAQAACKGKPGCRWVIHARRTDRNGRTLRDYCRVAGRRK